MNVSDYILIIALGQGYILAFFLLSSKYYKSTANFWLALATITLSTTSILDILGQKNPTNSILMEFFLNDLELSFLVYLPLYFYFRIITTSIFPNFKKDFYLFLPFLIDTIINILIVTNYSIDEIVESSEIQIFYEVEGVLSLVYSLFLCYKSYQLINQDKEKSIKKDWVFKIWQSTLMLLLIWVIVVTGSLVASEQLFVVWTLLYLIISVWIFLADLQWCCQPQFDRK